jgi:hypothetical protein
MMRRIRLNIEKRLYVRGFSSPFVRALLAVQLMVAAVGLVGGLLVSWLTLWPLLFGLGAALATFNFWHTARFAQAQIRQEFGPAAGIKLFCGFTLRLCLTGVILFLLIVRLEQPVAPLLAGLTSTVAGIALWGFSKASRKPAKEADTCPL